jgi:hypothetical protein
MTSTMQISLMSAQMHLMSHTAGYDTPGFGALHRQGFESPIKPLAWRLNIRQIYKGRQAQRHNTQTNLYRLPTELINEIALHLDTPDILCLSRTCQRSRHVQQYRLVHRREKKRFAGRLRRDRSARELVDEGHDLEALEWCCMCYNFHLKSSFEQEQFGVATDVRECRFWRSVVCGSAAEAEKERRKLHGLGTGSDRVVK